MIEECEVIKIKNQTAYVSLISKKKCGGCKGCAFGRDNKLSIPAAMKVSCKVGDKVKVEIPQTDVPAAALFIYLLPIIFLAIGFVTGGLINTVFRVIFALLFAAISFFLCVFIEKWFRKRQEYMAAIVEVIPFDLNISSDNDAEIFSNVETHRCQ